VVHVTVVIDGRSLAIDDVVRVAREGERAALAPDARERLRRARNVVDRALARGDAVYGLNTGVGVQKRFSVSREDEVWFNRRLLDNHHVGVGPDAPQEVVRAQLVRLLNGCAAGFVAVRPEVADRMVALLNRGPLPRVRLLGSLGQSDLAPNAEVAEAVFAGLDPAPGETLALINNNAFATGYAALALADAVRLLDASDALGALALEAFAANASALDPAVAAVRQYAGLRHALARLRELLAGSFVFRPGAARNLQDPLSFRNLPQQQGAARDVLDHARSVLAVELNAAQNNPLVVAYADDTDDDRIVSASEYEVLPLSAALDYARIGLAPLLTSVSERTMKLLDQPWSGLPTGLVAESGTVESGLSHYAITSQAVAAEARLLAQPVSFELVSTSGAEGIEDRMTMAPLAARRLADMVGLGEYLLAISILVAAQAEELRGCHPLGRGTGRLLAFTRERVPFMGPGDPLPPDLEPLRELVASGALSKL
jgi:histidine ammonia-lyase